MGVSPLFIFNDLQPSENPTIPLSHPEMSYYFSSSETSYPFLSALEFLHDFWGKWNLLHFLWCFFFFFTKVSSVFHLVRGREKKPIWPPLILLGEWRDYIWKSWLHPSPANVRNLGWGEQNVYNFLSFQFLSAVVHAILSWDRLRASRPLKLWTTSLEVSSF